MAVGDDEGRMGGSFHLPYMGWWMDGWADSCTYPTWVGGWMDGRILAPSRGAVEGKGAVGWVGASGWCGEQGKGNSLHVSWEHGGA